MLQQPIQPVIPHRPWPFPDRPPAADGIRELVVPIEVAGATSPPAPEIKLPVYPKYIHFRVAEEKKKDKYDIWPTGGYTVAYEVIPKDNLLRFCISKCSFNDNFNLTTARIRANRRLANFKKKPNWKMPSNEITDYLKHTDYYTEIIMTREEYPYELIVSYIGDIMTRDHKFKDFSLKQIIRNSRRIWVMV